MRSQRIKIKGTAGPRPGVRDSVVFPYEETATNPAYEIEITSTATWMLISTYRIDSSIWNDASRLTSMNPAVILWELMPYSFVIDWFYDLGGYLEELEAAYLSGLTWLDGYETWTHKHSARYKVPGQVLTYDYAGQRWKRTFYTHEFTEERQAKERRPLSSQPSPIPPGFKVDLGAARIASAAALLNQIFNKWRR